MIQVAPDVRLRGSNMTGLEGAREPEGPEQTEVVRRQEPGEKIQGRGGGCSQQAVAGVGWSKRGGEVKVGSRREEKGAQPHGTQEPSVLGTAPASGSLPSW